MTKQIKAFVEANKIVSEQGKWADEAWDEFMEEEALAEHPTNEDCSLVQEPAVWEHFDKAYQKAFTSSQPKDWMDAALMAQQVRNLQATPPKETQEPNGGMTDIVNKLIELRKMQSSNYNQTKKAFICDEAIARIKELEARLKFQDEWLSNGVYYTTDEAFKLHDDYNTKIAELTAKNKALEDRIAIAAEALEIYASGRGTYYHADTALTKIKELDK